MQGEQLVSRRSYLDIMYETDEPSFTQFLSEKNQ